MAPEGTASAESPGAPAEGTGEVAEESTKPWPQQLLESPWLLAGAALLYFTLSYIVWGMIDLLSVTPG